MAPRVTPEAFGGKRRQSQMRSLAGPHAMLLLLPSLLVAPCLVEVQVEGRQEEGDKGQGQVTSHQMAATNPRFAGDEPLIKSSRRQAQTPFYPRLRPEELLLPMMKKREEERQKGFSLQHLSFSVSAAKWTDPRNSVVHCTWVNTRYPAPWYPGMP